MIEVSVKKLHPSAKVPRVATNGSAYFDLHCCTNFIVSPGTAVKVGTGLAFEIPFGYFIEIVPRSGIASRGIIIPNSPCVIDSDYRGEVFIMFYGLYCKHEFFKVGSRVAQARLVKIQSMVFKTVDKLSKSGRGSGGFGSTGE